MTSPSVASSSRMISFISVGLAGPAGSDQEDEVALRDLQVDVPERLPAVGIALRHVIEDELHGEQPNSWRPSR